MLLKLSILLICAAPIYSSTLQCPKGFNLDKKSNYCFSGRSPKLMAYKEAKVWCEKKSGKNSMLPEIRSKALLDYFNHRAPVVPAKGGGWYGYWLGAERKGDKFKWEGGGFVKNKFTNYVKGQPDNKGGKENRLFVLRSPKALRGQWNDLPGNSRQFAICMAKPGIIKPKQCPKGFKLDKKSNYCFSGRSTKLMVYKKAKEWCEKKAGKNSMLPEIRSKALLDYFNHRAPVVPAKDSGYYGYWLGTERKGNKFKWERGGYVKGKFTNFAKGEPSNDKTQNRLFVVTAPIAVRGQWHDLPGIYGQFVICMAKPVKTDDGTGSGGGEISSVCVDPYTRSHHKHGTSWVSKYESFCFHYKCGTNGGRPLRTDCRDKHGKCVKASAGGRSFSCRHGKCVCLLKGGHTYVRHTTASLE